MYETVLLTGPAGIGKSTLAANLSRSSDIAVFEYGAELTRQASRTHLGIAQADIRSQSPDLVVGQDVAATDAALQRFVRANAGTKHVVIDSHAVTKESYGYRSLPFTPEQLKEVTLSRIVVLHCRPQALMERIALNPEGRSLLSEWEAAEFMHLQSTVALSYSVVLGIPVHFVDGEREPEVLRAEFMSILGSAPH